MVGLSDLCRSFLTESRENTQEFHRKEQQWMTGLKGQLVPHLSGLMDSI